MRPLSATRLDASACPHRVGYPVALRAILPVPQILLDNA